MTDEELIEMIMILRRAKTDLAGVEVKRARDRVPSSLTETLSAFSNTPGGGVIILGLDEQGGFEAVGVADPRTMQAKVAGLCVDSMAPPLRPLIQTHEFEDKVLLTIEIPELSIDQKPCFYKGSGQINGSYLRVGDGDYRMTPYEVHQFLAARSQPQDDMAPVTGASPDDLDPLAVSAFLAQVRASKPSYLETGDIDALRQLRVLTTDPEQHQLLVPSLAGLLALGRYPQQFFPQLDVTFVHYPDQTGSTEDVRFIDNRSLDGSVPTMVADALQALRANMRRRAVIHGAGREDVWDYPEEALREAVVNALVHRDYSPMAQGAQVQIEMYPDRLVIRNPGGLFGPVTYARLGEPGVASSRNALLLKLLESVLLPQDRRPICENRGSGLPAMIRATRKAGLSPPEFTDAVATFTVTFGNHTLMDTDALAWLATLEQPGLSDSQAQALVMMRSGEVLTNATYRGRFLMDSRIATQELADLTRRGLVEQIGTGRWTSYQLAVAPIVEALEDHRLSAKRRSFSMSDQDRLILELLVAGWSPTRAELAQRLGLLDRTLLYQLNRLRRAIPPLIERVGPARSPNTRYRITAAGSETLAE